MSNKSSALGLLDVTRAALPVAGGLYTGDLRGVQAGQAVANLIPTKSQRQASRLQDLQVEQAEFAAGRRDIVAGQQDAIFQQNQARNEQLLHKGEDDALLRDIQPYIMGATNLAQREVESSMRDLGLPFNSARIGEIMSTGSGQGFIHLHGARMALDQGQYEVAKQIAIRGGAIFTTDDKGRELMSINGMQFDLATMEDDDAFGMLAEEYGRGVAKEFRGDAYRAKIQNGDIDALAFSPVFNMAAGLGLTKGQAEAITAQVANGLSPEKKNLLLAGAAADQMFKGVQDEGMLEQANEVAGSLGVMGISFDGLDANADGRLDPSEIQVVVQPGTKVHELLYPPSGDLRIMNEGVEAPQRVSLDEFRTLVKDRVDLQREAQSAMPKPKLKQGSVVEEVERVNPGAIAAFLAANLDVKTSDKLFEAQFLSWLNHSPEGKQFRQDQADRKRTDNGDSGKSPGPAAGPGKGYNNPSSFLPRAGGGGKSRNKDATKKASAKKDGSIMGLLESLLEPSNAIPLPIPLSGSK